MAANRLVEKGAKSMICVQEEVGDGTQTERAAGMQQVAQAKGVKYDHVAGDPDPGKTAAIVEAYLRSHPDVDAVVGTGELEAILDAARDLLVRGGPEAA